MYLIETLFIDQILNYQMHYLSVK